MPADATHERDADLDGDGDVDGFDMAILLGSDGPCDVPGLCIADLNCTRDVDSFYLAILLGEWGSCPSFGGGASAMAGGPETGESAPAGPPTLAQQVDWLMDHGMSALVPALIEMWSQIDS